ncbi:sensor histidine kinase [Leifsonia sp. NPDC058292]|uniref:sensor histidine kinase n=1 Tax=Leifsonia sp. NPDC058292 TaxID=3346428 RepID=UPI0036DA7A27
MTSNQISLDRTASPVGGDLLLPRPPGVIRRFLASHPVLVDSLIAGVYLVPAIVGGIYLMVTEPSWQNGTRVVLSAIAGASLFLRRQHPWAVLVVAVVVMVGATLLGRDVDFLPAQFALYALAVYRSAKASWIAFAVVVAAATAALGLSALGTRPEQYTPFESGSTTTVIAVAAISLFWVLVGINIGNRRRYLAALIDRARQLARERDQQAVIAAAAERSRIAREMHDIVSHGLTVMITLADGSAGLATTAPERSAEAMRMVAETGRSALDDMRRLLGVLRATEGDAPEREPQPGVGELSELIEGFRAAGLVVHITVSGSPPSDTGQQLTVFRVVQEALTNALRYASLATAVEVSIAFTAAMIEITVDDDAAVHSTPGQGSGRGLIGLRERVGLYSGTLEAGPRPGGGWRVRARFETVRTPSALAAPGAPDPSARPSTSTDPRPGAHPLPSTEETLP